MRLFATIFLAVLTVASSSFGALAWWDTGHMAIAGIAYDRLDPAVRQKVDELIALNPDYQKWIIGVAPAQAAKFAFMRAALWADDQETELGLHSQQGNRCPGWRQSGLW